MQNRYYKKWSYHNTDWELLRNTNLYDTAIYNKYDSVQDGKIKFISERGVNISTPYGDKFIKWTHVKEIIKSL